jgi:hypothetical protein
VISGNHKMVDFIQVVVDHNHDHSNPIIILCYFPKFTYVCWDLTLNKKLTKFHLKGKTKSSNFLYWPWFATIHDDKLVLWNIEQQKVEETVYNGKVVTLHQYLVLCLNFLNNKMCICTTNSATVVNLNDKSCVNKFGFSGTPRIETISMDLTKLCCYFKEDFIHLYDIWTGEQ